MSSSRNRCRHGVHWLALAGIGLALLAGRAEDAPASPDETRATLTRGAYTFTADEIKVGMDNQQIEASGDAELVAPDGSLHAEFLHYNVKTREGRLTKAHGVVAPFHFRADQLTLAADGTKQLTQAGLTTCAEEHPHYQLCARDITVKPDGHYAARHVSVQFRGQTLFSLPRIAGMVGEQEETTDLKLPSLGYRRSDGVYLGTSYSYPLSERTALGLESRLGTRGDWRGSAALRHGFTLPGTALDGQLALVWSHHEIVPNLGRTFAPDEVDEETLRELSLSRQPALQLKLDPIPLSGSLRGFTARLGAGVGRIREHPTGVTRNRGQVWGMLQTPVRRLGTLRLHGKVGVQQAVYDGDTHRIGIAQLTLETPIDAETYCSLSLIHRDEQGDSPFLFERSLMPNELFVAVETPVSGDRRWFLGASNRFDLDRGTSRSTSVSAIYKQDCLAYELSYDTADRTVNFGVLLNAFGNFRKRPKGVEFVQ